MVQQALTVSWQEVPQLSKQLTTNTSLASASVLQCNLEVLSARQPQLMPAIQLAITDRSTISETAAYVMQSRRKAQDDLSVRQFLPLLGAGTSDSSSDSVKVSNDCCDRSR